MRSSHKINPVDLLDGLKVVDSNRIAESLKIALDVHQLHLEANIAVKDERKCEEIRASIFDTEALLCFVYLNQLGRWTR